MDAVFIFTFDLRYNLGVPITNGILCIAYFRNKYQIVLNSLQ